METQVKLNINDVADAVRAATGMGNSTVRFLADVDPDNGTLKELHAIVAQEGSADDKSTTEEATIVSVTVPKRS